MIKGDEVSLLHPLFFGVMYEISISDNADYFNACHCQ